MKKLLTLLLAVMATTATLFASSGKCGENVNWDFTGGVLTISGTGPMTDYDFDTDVPWYSVQNSITSVVIEDGITRIGNSAFDHCSNVASVAIPNSVISIGEYAFYACGMSSIIIPNNVETIEDYAFSNCYNLSTVTIGSGVKSIGYQAFAYDEALAVVTCNAMTPPTLGYQVFHFVPSSCVIYVPAESVDAYKAADGWKDMNIRVKGEPVITWDLTGGVLTISGTGPMEDYGYEKAPWFSQHASITSVIIEDGITTIGECAFVNCENIHSVTIPNSVTSIHGGAFSWCTGLLAVTIPENVESIGNFAFKKCAKLESITIPHNVTNIGDEAFSNCSSLTEITCEAITPPALGEDVFLWVNNTIPVYVPAESVDAYKAADGWNYFENIQAKGAGTNEIYAALSGSVMTIYYDDQKASRSSVLDKWTPEEGMLNVPDATHDLITKAVIDASMQAARPTTTYCWFFWLSYLTSIEGLAYLNTSEVTNMAGMFEICPSLTSLDLSGFNTDKVEDMAGMFQGCMSLTSLDLSSFNAANVTNTASMFQGCESLTTIYCDDAWNPSSSDDMFDGCTALVGGKGTKYDDSKTDKTYARPDGLDDQPGYFTSPTYTGEALIDGIRYFLYGDDMTAEMMPLGDGYYAGDIVLPEKVSYMKNDYAVTSVAGAAFSNCPELLTVTIPKSVNWIEPEVFYNSPKLTAVNVAAANANYSSLDGVLFNKAQTELRAYPTAKEGAYIVPESVETIMDATFAENKKLTAITLPASLYEIASRAFENCTGLEMIACRATNVPYLGGDVFAGVNKAIPVFVPKANIALYKAEYEWEDFTNYIAIEDKEAADAVIAKINAIGTVTYTPECKARIDAARGGYDALTAEQKVYITDATYKILTDAEKTYADLKKKADADQAAANIVIGKINAIGTVTLSSEAAILDARSAYDALTAAQQVLVTNYGVLTAAEKAYADLKKKADADQAAANAVIVKIDAIGTVTLSSEAAITAARSAYNALTADQKALVTNLSTLTAAEAALDQLKKQAAADQAAANIVISKISAIGTVEYTTESKARIDAAREAYEGLTAAQKVLVTNYGVLTAAEKAYADLKAKAEADQAAANAVIVKIDAIGEVTLASEPAIVAARSAYDALTDAQKALVTNYATLSAAEAKLDQLKKQAAAAAAVTDLINGIGAISYTTESKALIDAAREAYNALTDAQKALVPNYATLVAAEQVYEQLKAEAEADQKAANVVIDLIDQIGEVTLASEDAINAARTAYNSLTSIQQELVTNYGTLLAAETTLELLKQQATIDQAMADDVIARIEAIGEVTYTNNCYSRIFDARSAYDALSDVQKALVTNYATLTAAEARYAELEAQAKAVEEAKTQLKALVSEAAELKAVAMLYSPASVEQIDAIIENAQQTINDPYATVEDVNAKTEIIRGEIQFVGAALLEEAKEQLRQSIKALYQSGDYPSWYAAVIIPALNQVDEIMWDNDKTVQENILFFQTTGKAIYDTAKAALEALRASDTREIVSSCEFTGFTDAITVGMMWNEAALNTLVANLNASAATQPYHFIAEECMLTKWDAEYELFVGVDHHEGVVLTPGDYQFVANISIDGEAAAQYRFPKATEATLSVTVDFNSWSVDLSGILIDATYSSAYTTSPTFTLTEGQGFEETQDAQLKTQKIYHNGHFYILRGEHIYDLRGTLVR